MDDPGRAPHVDGRTTLRGLQDAQRAMYAGGDIDAVRRWLTPDVSWHVPGRNAIAGTYRGVDEVVRYFDRRRRLAGDSMRMSTRDVLVGEEHVAAVTDGRATLAGVAHEWSTVGLYRLRGGRVAACRMLPFDQDAFDRVWAGPADGGTV